MKIKKLLSIVLVFMVSFLLIACNKKTFKVEVENLTLKTSNVDLNKVETGTKLVFEPIFEDGFALAELRINGKDARKHLNTSGMLEIEVVENLKIVAIPNVLAALKKQVDDYLILNDKVKKISFEQGYENIDAFIKYINSKGAEKYLTDNVLSYINQTIDFYSVINIVYASIVGIDIDNPGALYDKASFKEYFSKPENQNAYSEFKAIVKALTKAWKGDGGNTGLFKKLSDIIEKAITAWQKEQQNLKFSEALKSFLTNPAFEEISKIKKSKDDILKVQEFQNNINNFSSEYEYYNYLQDKASKAKYTEITNMLKAKPEKIDFKKIDVDKTDKDFRNIISIIDRIFEQAFDDEDFDYVTSTTDELSQLLFSLFDFINFLMKHDCILSKNLGELHAALDGINLQKYLYVYIGKILAVVNEGSVETSYPEKQTGQTNEEYESTLKNYKQVIAGSFEVAKNIIKSKYLSNEKLIEYKTIGKGYFEALKKLIKRQKGTTEYVGVFLFTKVLNQIKELQK